MIKNISAHKDYRKYKPFLREEFSYTCVYCGTREPELGGASSFHIDHYKPVSLDPRLEAVYRNLLYSCRDCNQYKGNYWPDFLEKLSGYVILNVRTHNIDQHIDKANHQWEGKTTQGKWNIETLKLNSSRCVKIRKDRSQIENMIDKLEKDRNELRARKFIEKDVSVGEKIEQDIAAFDAGIAVLRSKIIGPMD